MPGESPAVPPERAEHGAGRKRTTSGKPKHALSILKLMAVWLVLIAGIILWAHRMWPQAPPRPVVAKTESPREVAESAEDTALINEAGPFCSQALAGFLSASSPEEQNQFVRSPVSTAERMARFYGMNPLTTFDPNSITPTGSAVVRLPGLQAVETHLTSPDGRRFDAVFVKENDEWRLDWEHYARYSEYPWALFLAGDGEAEGEFRLLARERLPEERKNEDTISLVLYAPRFGYANDTGFQSPEFLVKRDTRDGRLLEAAFKLERGGKQVFGVTLPNINPEGLIRVRVKIRRFEANGERRFEIKNVVACHWYSVDDPGVVVEEPPAEK